MRPWRVQSWSTSWRRKAKAAKAQKRIKQLPSGIESWKQLNAFFARCVFFEAHIPTRARFQPGRKPYQRRKRR